MSKWKIAVSLAAGVVVLLGGLLLVSKFTVEKEVKSQMELVGKAMTGRNVEVGEVSYNPVTWELTAENVCMKNPDGYSRDHDAVEIDTVYLKIAPWALMNRLVHIKELRIEGVALYPELKKIPLSWEGWLLMLMQPEINLYEFLPRRTAEGKNNNRRRSDKKKSKRLWYIKVDSLTVTDVKVHFVNVQNLKTLFLPPVVHDLIPETLELAGCRQTDLGADGKHTGADLAREILDRQIAQLEQWYEEKKARFEAYLKKQSEKYRRSWFRRKEKKEEQTALPTP